MRPARRLELSAFFLRITTFFVYFNYVLRRERGYVDDAVVHRNNNFQRCVDDAVGDDAVDDAVVVRFLNRCSMSLDAP